jgi:hypothetical protein
MAATRYWSVEDCCWVDQAAPDENWASVDVPQQRADEPAEEPVDA